MAVTPNLARYGSLAACLFFGPMYVMSIYGDSYPVQSYSFFKTGAQFNLLALFPYPVYNVSVYFGPPDKYKVPLKIQLDYPAIGIGVSVGFVPL